MASGKEFAVDDVGVLALKTQPAPPSRLFS
jgi:hypothetical protein